jgi:hypothetical protein
MANGEIEKLIERNGNKRKAGKLGGWRHQYGN